MTKIPPDVDRIGEEPLRFPPGFLWGTASSAHQVEGNNTNNQWWEAEQRPGAIWHGDKSGLACNWWQDAEADFDRMQALGLNAHRLSVEWSRIEPQPGEFDSAAIDRYRALLDGLRRRGIEPMVCLHHFSNPTWLQRAGSWERPEVVERFQSFVRYTVAALSDLNTMWLTINEPQIYVNHCYLEGIFPPHQRNTILALRVYRHMALAHGVAYQTIHALQPNVLVGNASALRAFAPLRAESRGDALSARVYDYMGAKSGSVPSQRAACGRRWDTGSSTRRCVTRSTSSALTTTRARCCALRPTRSPSLARARTCPAPNSPIPVATAPTPTMHPMASTSCAGNSRAWASPSTSPKTDCPTPMTTNAHAGCWATSLRCTAHCATAATCAATTTGPSQTTSNGPKAGACALASSPSIHSRRNARRAQARTSMDRSPAATR